MRGQCSNIRSPSIPQSFSFLWIIDALSILNAYEQSRFLKSCVLHNVYINVSFLPLPLVCNNLSFGACARLYVKWERKKSLRALSFPASKKRASRKTPFVFLPRNELRIENLLRIAHAQVIHSRAQSANHYRARLSYSRNDENAIRDGFTIGYHWIPYASVSYLSSTKSILLTINRTHQRSCCCCCYCCCCCSQTSEVFSSLSNLFSKSWRLSSYVERRSVPDSSFFPFLFLKIPSPICELRIQIRLEKIDLLAKLSTV